MTNWTAAELPDMAGKVVLITGGTSGIGKVIARELARVGAHVVLAVRNVAKGTGVANAMTGDVTVLPLDVSDLASVRSFADSWTGDIDVLINNAGIMQVPFSRTADGFESQVATNFLGPYALTNLLLPHITGRVVTVSSQLHRFGGVHIDNSAGSRPRYNATFAYCDSKLEATMFAIELDRRLKASRSDVRSIVAHPGIVAGTSLVSHVGGAGGWAFGAFSRFYNDVEHGALPTLYAVTQDVPGASYVGPDGFASIKGLPKIRKPSRAARDRDRAKTLWSQAATLTGTSA